MKLLEHIIMYFSIRLFKSAVVVIIIVTIFDSTNREHNSGFSQEMQFHLQTTCEMTL